MDELLPLTFRLDGKPMDVINRRPMFRQLFKFKPHAKRQIWMCGRQVGKAEDVDTEIPTPTGFTRMGDLKPGDVVIAEDGTPTRVVAVTPWMYGRDCYEIEFDCAQKSVVDGEHLWKISDESDVESHEIVSTLELIRLTSKEEGFRRFFIKGCFGFDKHHIRSIKKVESRPVRCIQIEHPSQMYLTGRSMIPTHNTAQAGGWVSMNMGWRKDFRVLYVTPLALYTNRFHHIYMAKMLRGCTLPWKLQDSRCTSNVNEKTFVTGSHFHGVSCFNSPGNALGIPADCVVFDEVQDLNVDHIPQILEVLGTSDYRFELYFGTARGLENTIQRIFDQSSKAERVTKCSGCNHWNIPLSSEDGLAMIQKAGICCAKCGKLLDLDAHSEWAHAHPDRAKEFCGWHVPQIAVKDRVYPHDKYIDTIYNKLHGLRAYPRAKFLNEVMGESVEMGSTAISDQQIRAASILDISPDKMPRMHEYGTLGAGVDWGGSEVISFTVGTIVGLHHTGNFHVLGAIRPTGIPDNERHFPIAAFLKKYEEKAAVNIFATFADGLFVGPVQNKNLQAVSGIQTGNIFYGTTKKLFVAHPGTNFTVDRTTILYIVYSLIKAGKLLFPKGEWFETFTSDLRSNYITQIDTSRGQIQRYERYSTMADDFLHALGYGLFACALGAGVDLPSLIGLDVGTTVTREYVDTVIGSEEWTGSF